MKNYQRVNKNRETALKSPELPEFLVLGGEVDMGTGISASSNVPQPHIKAMVGKEIGKALVDQVCQPVGRATQETMLQEYYRTRFVTWKEEGNRKK